MNIEEIIAAETMHQFIVELINSFDRKEIEYMAKIDYDFSNIKIDVPPHIVGLLIKYKDYVIKNLTIEKMLELAKKYEPEMYEWIKNKYYIHKWINRRIFTPLRQWLLNGAKL